MVQRESLSHHVLAHPMRRGSKLIGGKLRMPAPDFHSTQLTFALFHFKALDQSLWCFRNINCGGYLNFNIHSLSTLRALVALQQHLGRLNDIG
jgi:hypothetical protein